MFGVVLTDSAGHFSLAFFKISGYFGCNSIKML